MASSAGYSPYQALIDSSASFAGVDQGIDFTGPGTVYNPFGSGVVERVVPSDSGWAGEGALLTYEITDGPYAGKHVYVAEDFQIDPRLQRGSALVAGQALGRADASGKAPGIEVGWADASGHAYGHAFPREAQPMGADFRNAVTSLSAQSGFGKAVHNPIRHGGVVGSGARAGGGVGAQTADAGQQAVGFITGTEDALRFLFSYRGLEVIGGGVLIIIGLVGLMREVGVKSPTLPGPAGKVASTATGGK